MKVLVCGGRDFCDYESLRKKLDFLHVLHRFTEVIHGAASGADSLAGEWAALQNIGVTKFPAQWGKYGKAAGYIRNKQMLDEGKPNWVIAFPGGKGTANMIRLAQQYKIPVLQV